MCGEKHCPRSDLSFSFAHTALPVTAAAATAPPAAADASVASASSATSSSSATSGASSADAKPERLLRTWEVNFAYVEHGTKKNALVKLRAHLCSVAELSGLATARSVRSLLIVLFVLCLQASAPSVPTNSTTHTSASPLFFALYQ